MPLSRTSSWARVEAQISSVALGHGYLEILKLARIAVARLPPAVAGVAIRRSA
jgi:hypothetical protein